jgi:hypothetical protein
LLCSKWKEQEKWKYGSEPKIHRRSPDVVEHQRHREGAFLLEDRIAGDMQAPLRECPSSVR